MFSRHDREGSVIDQPVKVTVEQQYTSDGVLVNVLKRIVLDSPFPDAHNQLHFSAKLSFSCHYCKTVHAGFNDSCDD